MTYHNRKDIEVVAERHRRARGTILAGKRMWIILILGVIGVTALLVLGSIKTKGLTSESTVQSTFTARRDDLIITVTESGSINARNTIDITCQVEAGRMGGGVGGGGVTILDIVPEGTYITPEDVNEGKVLVELDSSVLEEQIEQYEIDVESAKASYTEAEQAHLIQEKQNESDVTAAELAVKFAKMDFQKYLGEDLAEEVINKLEANPDSYIDVASLIKDVLVETNDPSDPNDLNDEGGEASQMLKELGDAILLADGQLQKATDVFEGTQRLYDANYASALDLQTARLDVQRYTVQKQSAIEALRLYKRYDLPKEAEKYLSDYEEAKRELDRTKARATSLLAQAKAKLLSAKARYDLQQARLDKAKDQIAACTIRAPAPGLVVYASSADVFRGRRRGNSRTIAEGETVSERQKIITLPDTAEMIAEIAVHETDVDKVRPGQRALVTVDPFPDETFKARVLKVTQLPDAQRGFLNPDLKVYTTQVLIEGTHEYLKPGMSAKVEILVQQLKDVIIVPVTVVANRQGKKVCFVLKPDGSVEERVVTTGAFDDTFVQIVEGLEEGEEVLLNPPRITETGSGRESRERSKRFQSDEPGAGRSTPDQQPRGPRPQDGGGPRAGGPEDGQPEITDEMADRILGMIEQREPEEAKKLKQLRQSNPKKFKAELRQKMRAARNRMRQGGNPGGQGGNAGARRRQNQ